MTADLEAFAAQHLLEKAASLQRRPLSPDAGSSRMAAADLGVETLISCSLITACSIGL